MDIYPPFPQPFDLSQIFGGQTNTDWLEEDIEHLPFAEVIFWARRINTEQLEKPSQYSMSVFQKKHPELCDKSKPIQEQYLEYQKWRSKQPPEGDLRTNFGKRVERWFENTGVGEQFVLAFKTYGWFLVNKCKEIARKKQAGAMFTDSDWGHLIRCRQVLSDLDQAMYSMEMHNAGAWDLDVDLAQEFCWVEVLWFFAQQENVDITSLWSKYDKIKVRNNPIRQWWWEATYDLLSMPDELDGLFDNGTVTIPLDGGQFVSSL